MAWLTRPDGSVVVGYGPFREVERVNTADTAFYVQDFALKADKPWRIPAAVERLSSAAWTARVESLDSGAGIPELNWHAVDAVPFSGVFQEVMASIHAGVFEKTVPVVTEIGTADRAPAAAIRAAVGRQQPPLLGYGWYEAESGFAGATPELLVSLNGHRLETMALAGTARSEDREVFAVDEKEIREHEYVAQTLVAKLLDLGSLERKSREILDLGSIVHFLTRIRVDLRAELTPEEVIGRLHPTPALGPLPRTDVTLARLLEWRQRLGCPPAFGAPFGVWDRGSFCSVVAIRGIWWAGTTLRIPAGCGVIEASRLVNEWRELRLKRESVKRFLTAGPAGVLG